jgi:hypothetical protein
MPPKSVKKTVVHDKTFDSDDSDCTPVVAPLKVTKSDDKLLLPKSVSRVPVKINSSDSSRTQLAQATNNLTIKADQFIEAVNAFSVFKENIAQIDIQIETKKQEHTDELLKLEKEYEDKNSKLTAHFEDKTSKLTSHYEEKNKKLDEDYKDKNKSLQNEFKNTQIDIQQKLSEFKLKSCEEMAKQFNMLLIKADDHKITLDNINRANTELEQLHKTIDSKCNAIQQEEKTKCETRLKHQVSTLELNHKAEVAEMKAQLEQQKKEIEVLCKTIDHFKHEIAEQRTLTKDIALASSKSQIHQKFGKE